MKKIVFGDKIRIKVFDEYSTPISDDKMEASEIESYLKKIKKKFG